MAYMELVSIHTLYNIENKFILCFYQYNNVRGMLEERMKYMNDANTSIAFSIILQFNNICVSNGCIFNYSSDMFYRRCFSFLYDGILVRLCWKLLAF
jgi:hypothetical protein